MKASTKSKSSRRQLLKSCCCGARVRDLNYWEPDTTAPPFATEYVARIGSSIFSGFPSCDPITGQRIGLFGRRIGKPLRTVEQYEEEERQRREYVPKKHVCLKCDHPCGISSKKS